MTAVPDQLLKDLLPRLQAVLPAGGQLAGLERRGARIALVHRALWGTAYVAVGRMPGGDRAGGPAAKR